MQTIATMTTTARTLEMLLDAEGITLPAMTPAPAPAPARPLHWYAVEIWKDGGRTEIDVDAVNRTQAAAMVRKMGYEPRAVNMLS